MVHIHEYNWHRLDLNDPWIRLCACGFSPDRPAWRVLVTGSRSLTDPAPVVRALTAELLHAQSLGLPMVVVEGQCPHGGADRFAESFYRGRAAAWFNIWHDPFPANWEALGKIAGPYRNSLMVAAGADVCLAFPTGESRGTWDCVRKAEDAGIPVKVFEQ